MAVLVPIIVVALIVALCTMKDLGSLNATLAEHGGPPVQCRGGSIISALTRARTQDLLCLELALTP
jgi:hypothetical protein